MFISNVLIEVTRRCNMACDHCLRGDTQAIDISHDTIDTFLSRVKSISNLTITGGEPSLVPDRISYIVHCAEQHKVTIDSFYIATNGKVVSNAFLMAIMDLYLYCGTNETSQLALSNDEFHADIPSENLKKLEVFKFFGKKDSEDYPLSPDNLIEEGRAISYGGKSVSLSRLEVTVMDGEGYINDGDIYLNALGNIVGECDLSYETQDRPELIICKVDDEDYLQRVKEYNKRIEGIKCVCDLPELAYA